MIFGRGFPFSQDNGIPQNGDSGTPLTPVKSTSWRSEMIPIDTRENQTEGESWNDLLGMYSYILQQSPDMTSVGKKYNPSGGLRQSEGNHNIYEGTGQMEGVSNLALSQNGRVRNDNLGMGHIGGVQNVNVGLGYKTEVRNVNVGISTERGPRIIHAGMGQNQSSNIGSGQNAPIQNWNVDVGKNEGNQNRNVGMTQGNPSQNGYSSTSQNDPANWSSGHLATLLKGKKPASFATMNGATKTSIQVKGRTVIPNSSTPVESKLFGSAFSSSMHREYDQTIGSSQQSRGYDLQQSAFDGVPVSNRPMYNLNSPPRAEVNATSSIANLYQVEPVTPDKGKPSENHHTPPDVNCSVYGSSSLKKDGQEQLVVSRSENNENHCNEMLQNIASSSSSAVSTTMKEQIVLDERVEQSIDLNKTPQQKTPKRRKHRPKVVRECKLKKTPKPNPQEKSNPNETPSGKRKYVRKKGLKISETQQPNELGQISAESPQGVIKRKYVRKKSLKTPETHQGSAIDDAKVPAAANATKSCKRSLNFDLESAQNNENQKNQGSKVGFNLNINPQDTELYSGISSISKASAVQIEEQKGSTAGLKNPQSSSYQMQMGNSSLSEPTAPATPYPKLKIHPLNAIARNVMMRSSTPGQNAQLNGYNQVDRHALKADTARINHERGKEQMLNSTSQLLMKDLPSFEGKKGLKRHSFEHIYSDMHSPFMYPKMSKEAIESSYGSNHFDTSCLESNKKKKMQDGYYMRAVNDSSGQERRGINGVQAKSSISEVLNTYFGEDKTSDKVTNVVNLATDNAFLHPMSANKNLQKPHVGFKPQSCAGKSQVSDFIHVSTPPKGTGRFDYLQDTRTRHANWLKHKEFLRQSSSSQKLRRTDLIIQQKNKPAAEGHRPLPTPKETSKSDYLQEIRNDQGNLLKPKEGQNTSSGSRRGMHKMLQQQQKNADEGHQPFSTKARGAPKKQKYLPSVEEITNGLEALNISGHSSKEHALVPYNADNSLVPFEPKKRKPRPRVDLDPETVRLWNLLMGKEGSEGAEPLDKDKEKWWEEERAVFQGRANAFIARMHLVQGDRRFSRWKGSVVDSVIGVFLTQNVSDHLSSSAFMSLAAKFPLHTTATNESCCHSETKVSVEEPDIQIIEQQGSIKHHVQTGKQTIYNHRMTEGELVSQDSFNSVGFQNTDEQRSSSGSNSEADDQATGSQPIKPASTLMDLLQGFDNGSTMLEERTANMRCQSQNQESNRQNFKFIGGNNLKSSSPFSSSISSKFQLMQELRDSNLFKLNMIPNSQKLGVQYGATSAEKSLSSLPSTASGVTDTTSGVTDTYNMSNWTYHQSERQIPQTPTFDNNDFLSKHSTHQIGSGPNSTNNQKTQNSKVHQVERAFRSGPTRESDEIKQGSMNSKFKGKYAKAEDRMSGMDKKNCFENAAVEANSKEQTCSSGEPLSSTATNNVKMKKVKAEDEKKTAFDWDSLRKQVLLNGGKKERSKDAMDSLDYEALRNADVKEISDTIRERGMNKMLAERMKDFLNRLVRDHESIDLEWLRDVAPDKAKEYLLSIRGLGLKSAECVRLLTLHHLAFPVDTNVGRIAVRLGWVPLQPLPESVQLHLLELYPVLETIQKYLWPRLCKLDQPTLYELHYQMITFGKVFCTKSKPNCNACPMRAECRHFASAFASARLALPGLEEKSIVSSAIPIVDDDKPKEAMKKPLSLPPAENNPHRDAGFFDLKHVPAIKQPIIEYPSSPHSKTTEILERDIEDAFYEDPDDIPTINLNMGEFTANLHNFMQDNTDLKGEMSKALVALNPEAASIPTPKLKNVSRLRTEHRVYELPDSHPLLDGVDRRETDDPSPYLLAIWTPGETADSIQPPESTCSTRKLGSLCNDNTCFSCNSTREANSQTVRGTLLIPCRTSTRGRFPLNGTYFQVNEVFADHESSMRPIDVPRRWLWNLPRRTVFFGTSVSTIFKGMTAEEIQACFWRGYVCVRGIEQKTRAPRPLIARLHFPASKFARKRDEGK